MEDREVARAERQANLATLQQLTQMAMEMAMVKEKTMAMVITDPS
jgi:hypothetical protein